MLLKYCLLQSQQQCDKIHSVFFGVGRECLLHARVRRSSRAAAGSASGMPTVRLGDPGPNLSTWKSQSKQKREELPLTESRCHPLVSATDRVTAGPGAHAEYGISGPMAWPCSEMLCTGHCAVVGHKLVCGWQCCWSWADLGVIIVGCLCMEPASEACGPQETRAGATMLSVPQGAGCTACICVGTCVCLASWVPVDLGNVLLSNLGKHEPSFLLPHQEPSCPGLGDHLRAHHLLS